VTETGVGLHDTRFERACVGVVAVCIGCALERALILIEVAIGVDRHRADQVYRMTKHTGPQHTLVTLGHLEFRRAILHERLQTARRLQIRNRRLHFTFGNMRRICAIGRHLLTSETHTSRQNYEQDHETMKIHHSS